MGLQGTQFTWLLSLHSICIFAFVLLMFFWTVISISLTVCLTVEFIGLYHDMRGRESDIDFWTLIDEPQIDTFGSMQEHATENYGKNVN